MTVLAPEFLQTTKYSAQRMRQLMATGGMIQEGIYNVGDFQVKQRGAGANMSVDVTAGDAWVQGDNTARQGWYHVGNDATVNVAVPAAHATLPRIDQVVLRIYDSTVIGGEKDLAAIEVVSGTATAAASLANLTGTAALPSSAIRLGYVLVPAAGTKIETAQIGNLKDHRAGLTGYPASASPLAVAGAPPMYALGRPALYVPTCITIVNAQAIASFAGTGLAFSTEDVVDNDAMHDPVTENEKVFCKTPGNYQISAQAKIAVSSAGLSCLVINKNGNNYRWITGSSFEASWGAWQVSEGSFTMRLAYGDYVSAQYLQGTGSSRSVFGALEALWVGP